MILFRMFSIGMVFGLVISRIGFYDFDVVNSMFLLENPRPLFSFCLAVVLIGGFNFFVRRLGFKQSLHFQPGLIMGSLFFGVGWAVTGACPGMVLVQLAHGKLMSILTFFGICVGIISYRVLNSKFLKWNIISCGDD